MRRLLTGVAFAACAVASAGIARAQVAIGENAGALTVAGADGEVTIAPEKAKATVVLFVSAQCPVSVAYNARMNALHHQYADKGVQVFFLNANITETAEQIADLGTPTKLGFTVYRDTDNRVADKLGATATPEAYVFDSKGVLRYHGAIDDSRDEKEVKTKSLQNAIDAVIDGKNVEVATTKAFGCSIKRKPAA